jgi:hypothetical protein
VIEGGINVEVLNGISLHSALVSFWPDAAITAASWVSSLFWRINTSGFVNVRGTFGPDNVLYSTLRSGAKISYIMNPNSSITGYYELRGELTTGLFVREGQ